jgi:hypothetical protein
MKPARLWLVGSGVVLLQVPFILTRHIQEDAYITFRCAMNLAETGVYGFNAGERVSASTAHLSVLMIALLRLLSGRAFIWLAQILYGVATVWGTYLLSEAVVADRRQRISTWVAVSVLPVSLIIAYGGMETGLLILLMGAILRSTTQSTFSRWCGAALLLLPWVRPDAVAIGVLVLAAGVTVGRPPLRVTASYGALILVGALSWALFNRLYFGDWLTQTIIGKAVAASPAGLGDALRDGVNTLGQLWLGTGPLPGMLVPVQTRYLSSLTAPAFVLSLAGTLWLVAHPSRFGAQRAPVVALALVAFAIPPAYAFAGVLAPWYLWPSQLAAFLLLIVVGVGWLIRQPATPRRVAAYGGIAMLELLILGQWCLAVSLATQEHLYRGGIGEQIKSISARGDTLFLEPAGYIPFYAQLYTWDETGLASPSVTKYKVAYGPRWWVPFVRDMSPTFLLERDEMLGYQTHDGYQLSSDERDWFRRHYRLVRVFTYDPSALRSSPALRYIAGLGSAGDYLLYQRLPMPPTTPYTADLDGREPTTAMRETAARYRSLAGSWSPPDFERTYAPGKWTARQILIHLAQAELALGSRARMALTTPNYTAQNFDQDQWIAKEHALGGREALDAFLALVTMNGALFGSLSPADRAISLSHPEYGALTVDWIIHTLAGHEIHHLKQLEIIGIMK